MEYGMEALPEPQVGDLVELLEERSATKGARAVVLCISELTITVRWINELQEGRRHAQQNGAYESCIFKLVERM